MTHRPSPSLNQGPVEAFKPIPVRRRAGLVSRVLFALRLVADLQLLTCTRFLAPHLAHCHGTVIDVGCGEMPFRGLLPKGAQYTGIDVAEADDFGMRGGTEIVAFDGRTIPFPDESFDHVMCTEVLEHAREPEALIAEMYRVLKPGGTLLATVPFAARVHHAPHDFHRFTRYRLADLFAGFAITSVEERGDDLAVIANKLIVVCARLCMRGPAVAILWRLPALVVLLPLSLAALGVAHLSLALGWGSTMDPLGYAIVALKE